MVGMEAAGGYDKKWALMDGRGRVGYRAYGRGGLCYVPLEVRLGRATRLS
jgi:hypothetical protein